MSDTHDLTSRPSASWKRLVRHLGDELAGFRERALAAEARLARARQRGRQL